MPTDIETIHSYSEFAPIWSQKNKNDKNLAQKYIEKPAMYEKLSKKITPQSNVLCIGCGTGEECVYIKERFTKYVTGIDISSGMINEAKRLNKDIDFYVMDMEKLSFKEDSFDIVYASLSLYYFKSIDTILNEVHRILKKGGYFIFSMPHPVKWSALKIDNTIEKSYKIGFTYHKDTNQYEIFGDYLTNYEVTDSWFGKKIKYFNHPIGTTIQSILSSTFKLIGCIEPKSIVEAKDACPDFWDIHQRIPLFIIYELEK